MKGFDLILTLKDDCVLSERAATEGGHVGLDYIPGATLLGVAAAKLYRQFPADAFTLFHSGQLRFGNGLPVGESGETSWPMPFCWHHAKGEITENNRQLIADRISRLENGAELPGNKQPQQLRAGYVTGSGELVKPKKSLRMKTAINPKTGRAFDAMLFGYDALSAGQKFCARISADDNVSDMLIEQVKAALTGEILLGRSRSAEYGRVDATLRPITETAQGKNAETTITLWLLSDLAALDDAGQPTLNPRPQHLGLPEGRLLVERSYLRTRRYSPWNAKRGGSDIERQVISQGSVLVFELESPLDTLHHNCIAAGLGAHREAGLGQVWLNPNILEGVQPQFADVVKVADVAKVVDAGPHLLDPQKSDLIQWLESRSDQGADFAAQAREVARTYAGLLASARKLKGLDDKTEIGPSPSQWGSVLALAKSPVPAFPQSLFDNNNGPCKLNAPGWQDEHWDHINRRPRNFACWLREVLGDNPAPRLVQHLARELMDAIRKEAPR